MLAPACPSRGGTSFPTLFSTVVADVAIAMGEESGVDQVALVAGSRCGGVISCPAPALLIEEHPALEQFGAGPSAIRQIMPGPILGGASRRRQARGHHPR